MVSIIQAYTVLVALTDLHDSTPVVKFLANTEKRHMFDYAKKEASIVYRYDDIIYDSFLWLHGIALHFASDDIALKRDSLDDPYTSLQ